jgi:hypothetical protein
MVIIAVMLDTRDIPSDSPSFSLPLVQLVTFYCFATI